MKSLLNFFEIFANICHKNGKFLKLPFFLIASLSDPQHFFVNSIDVPVFENTPASLPHIRCVRNLRCLAIKRILASVWGSLCARIYASESAGGSRRSRRSSCSLISPFHWTLKILKYFVEICHWNILCVMLLCVCVEQRPVDGTSAEYARSMGRTVGTSGDRAYIVYSGRVCPSRALFIRNREPFLIAIVSPIMASVCPSIAAISPQRPGVSPNKAAIPSSAH